MGRWLNTQRVCEKVHKTGLDVSEKGLTLILGTGQYLLGVGTGAKCSSPDTNFFMMKN